MFFHPPPPPPVSYGREVAPILALHCNGCHGDAGGLSTSSHRDLMKGGNMGKVIVAGDADRSLLIHFIDGRRGEAHRMPLGGRPLTAAQIDTIARWIAAGGKDDAQTPPEHTLRLPRVQTQPGRVLRIYARVNTPAYLVLTLRASAGGDSLLVRSGSLKTPRDPGDLAEPGELITWEVRPERGWPRVLDLELTIRYAARPPENTEFRAELI